MAIFTGSTVTGDPAERLPYAWGTPDYESQSDSYRLGWLAEVVQEGDRINRDDPAADDVDEKMGYVLGQQLRNPEHRPGYLPRVVINETKRSVRRHASALTDVKPVFGFKTFNPDYQMQAQLLNWLTIAWWINTFADLALVDVIKYAAVIGTGDAILEYDPHWGAGEQILMARDFRDTLPYRPGRSPSIQHWRGAVLREEHPVATLRALYPDKHHLLVEDSGTAHWGRGVFSRFRQAARRILTPAGDGLDHLRKSPHTGRQTGGGIVIYRGFFKDASVNVSSKPILMGKPGEPWSYFVEPFQKLYPRGRLIVGTERAMLYDGPNPYWHGMVPAARLRLDPWPWNFLGLGLTHDQAPIQDAINELAQAFLGNFQQAAHRPLIADKSAMPQGMFEKIDTRKPGWKAKLNTVMGKGMEVVEPPALPPWSMEFFQFLMQKHGELSGTANLEVLQQLKQMPSDATLQKFFEALTPELRLEGRYIELFLRELAEQAKFNFFQFYSTARRVQILGQAGVSLRDFDYAPGNLVPAMDPGEQGYTPELDKSRSHNDRAQYFARTFTFFVTPNSVLALNAQEEQLKYLQLARMGMMDVWSLWEKLDIPNAGEPPPLPLPPMEAVDPVVALSDPARYQLDPMSGQILEIRKPQTIMERLLAQNLLGLAMAGGPAGANPNAGGPSNPKSGGGGGARPGAGRKSAGEAPPKIEQKKDDAGAPRTTVTESRHD